jgi:C-terminal processing protease CtpA/Prc
MSYLACLCIAAYIRVRELNSVAAANVEDAVKKLSVYDPSMYILDLRNNLGGLLSV